MNHKLWSRGRGASEEDEPWERTNMVCFSLRLRYIIKKKIALKCNDHRVLKNKEKVRKFYEFWFFQPLVFGG